MSASYQVITQELTPAQQRRRLVSPQNAIASVTVLQLPVGSNVGLRLGQSSDSIPVKEGDQLVADPCYPENDGLYLDINTAAVGSFIVLYVGFSQGPSLQEGA